MLLNSYPDDIKFLPWYIQYRFLVLSGYESAQVLQSGLLKIVA